MRAEFSGESFQDEDKAGEQSSIFLCVHRWPGKSSSQTLDVASLRGSLKVSSDQHQQQTGLIRLFGGGGEFLRYKYGVEGQVQGTL